jgi:hypothetical protein
MFGKLPLLEPAFVGQDEQDRRLPRIQSKRLQSGVDLLKMKPDHLIKQLIQGICLNVKQDSIPPP